MTKPHINIKRESSSWNSWCVHYDGMMEAGASLKKKIHCKAGVEYATVEKKVDYTYSRDGGHKYEAHSAHPCFKHELPLTEGCAKCRFPTPEEIMAHDEDATGWIKKITIAHKAILTELQRRHSSGDELVKLNANSHHEVEDGPTGFLSGSGFMACPVCSEGKLRYSRASYNGHVHAHCSTSGCVSWMQ